MNEFYNGKLAWMVPSISHRTQSSSIYEYGNLCMNWRNPYNKKNSCLVPWSPDLYFSLCLRLRTLSSQGTGSGVGPPSPNKATTTTPTTNLVKKFKLAEFRYGKEELLQLFVQDSELPTDMPLIPPICQTQTSLPLAFIPLSEEEQVSLEMLIVVFRRGGIFN